MTIDRARRTSALVRKLTIDFEIDVVYGLYCS
ncbi:hypothetical protein LSS_20935 [Leptospira santarosai serovar Shermani str. LT 821]|uniref:Uncharacterized protein n=1 Tax=Leptospira santarosai serovar Shermani str. LT 821 TaxID=758847 RepID=A0A097ESB1_9LEPT|nr:hypothetical protein LSS_20935 [Leptospira santarosai serovar Shermani str. LT 821]